jgi:16S rRNA G966 N2-methylase RsmD
MAAQALSRSVKEVLVVDKERKVLPLTQTAVEAAKVGAVAP